MSAEIAAGLRRAAQLIDTPQKWCQGTLARDAAGEECKEFGPSAAQWCAMGAIIRVSRSDDLSSRWGDVCFALRRHLRIGNTGAWNDDPSRTHAEVVAALLAAAEAEERADG